jgi:peptidoglycan/xylan/chitin deacetylase (PgdA/CDA1 family)
MKHICVLIFLLLVSAPAFAQSKSPVRTMVVTIDDLPYIYIGDGPSLPHAQQGTRNILHTLQKYHVPATAFVNEGHLAPVAEREARIDLLREWVNAGMVLGNHTYSHPDFNRLTVEEFESEIIRGDEVSRQLMKSRGSYQLYFRHPMTHTGDTQEKKEAIEKFLTARGYKVTPHTIENSDFIFNVDYEVALQKQDDAMARRVANAYLEFTIAATEFAEKTSSRMFGHEIPQTLLIHANGLNADYLDELLQRFAARGYRFITLDEAMSDPAYKTKDALITKFGPTWLWRWNQSLGLNVNFSEDPEPPQWVNDSYKQWGDARAAAGRP